MLYRNNVSLTAEGYEAWKRLPREMKVSKLLRCILFAVTYTDKEWSALLKKDAEVKEVRDWLKEKLDKRFFM